MFKFNNIKGLSIIETLIAATILSGTAVLVYPTVKPLLQQSAKVNISTVSTAYQIYLEENLSSLEPWLPYSTDLEAGTIPESMDLQIGSVHIASHPQTNPTYLDKTGGHCDIVNGEPCSLKVELEVKDFNTDATLPPDYRYAYRITALNDQLITKSFGAPGSGPFVDADFINQVPSQAYINSTSSACVGNGIFMHALDKDSLMPRCVYAPSLECGENQVPTGYRIVKTDPASNILEFQWVCTPVNQISCPDGFVLKALNAQQFLNESVANKSVCTFAGRSPIDLPLGSFCPEHYESSEIINPDGSTSVRCSAPADVPATVSGGE